MRHELQRYVSSMESSTLLSAEQLEVLKSLAERADTVDPTRLVVLFLQRAPSAHFAVHLVLSIGSHGYDIEQLLGKGGMGIVFRVTNRSQGSRPEALKAIRQDLTLRQGAMRRFAREIRFMQSLDNAHLVRIYACFLEDTSQPFFTMELLTGVTLDKHVNHHGPLPLSDALSLILRAATGLHVLHNHRIIHRDLKPNNLILDSVTSTVRVLDLGLARRAPRRGPTLADSSDDLTRTGTALGHIHYMAPEQASDAKRVRTRADIYSLGCVLHYLLTATPPYTGATVADILHAKLHDPVPDLRAHRAEVSTSLQTVFERMLARNPSDRYGKVADLIHDLRIQLAAI